MALARAFTTISKRTRKQTESAPAPAPVGRAASQRGGRPVLRADISSPMALVSTSNMQIHDAKHIAGTASIDLPRAAGTGVASSASSRDSLSGDDSDFSVANLSGSEAVTDASSFDESPLRSEPEPNHLSCYFKPAVDTSITRSRSSSASCSPVLSSPRDSFDSTPRIPQRVPSHSKKAHERVHRTRSLQRIMSPGPSSSTRRALHDVVRSSTDLFRPSESSFVEAPRDAAPFGQELAQLDEVAEEYGQVIQKVDADAEVAYMRACGLAHFAAHDYMTEIQSLVYETFGSPYHENAAGVGEWF